MRIIRSFPHPIREIEHVWIPMSDGCRLSARVWLPASALDRPAPAVVEYIPYRKRDGTRWRDEPIHAYFAGHGYAAVRVDLRGTGESEGVLLDEYLPQEQDDGVEVLRWVAAQPWCDGNVGLMGKSWGGINALQIAARRPPELKAIITVCSTDDRYTDDAHYMGGCLLMENLRWGAVLQVVNAQPPDPAIVGARWRDMWRQRLERTPLFPAVWMRHPHRDAYWRQGSVAEDLGRVACPVYAVGGWADAYTNTVPRLLAGLGVPRKGLVGPWGHVYPHAGRPGPAIGFLQEALAWWDHCLRGREGDLLSEPAFRVWMPEHAPPSAATAGPRPGRWVAEARWPSERVTRRTLHLHAGRLDAGPAAAQRLEIASPQTVGRAAGNWCSFGTDDLPADQRADDAGSLVFDSVPLDERLEVLGVPEVTLDVAADRPVAHVVVRLCDVSPDGASSRVTYGVLNLTHRDGHAAPQPLAPGRRYTARVPLGAVAHAFPPGHRLRLAVSTAYWPILWPSPAPVRLSLWTGHSRLVLPVRPPGPADASLRAFPPPEAAAPPATEKVAAGGGVRRSVERDPRTGELVHRVIIDMNDAGEPSLERLVDIDLEVGHGLAEVFRIRDDDPLSASAEVTHRTVTRRGDWDVRVEVGATLRATVDAFLLEARLEAREGGEGGDVVVRRVWNETIPRALV